VFLILQYVYLKVPIEPHVIAPVAFARLPEAKNRIKIVLLVLLAKLMLPSVEKATPANTMAMKLSATLVTPMEHVLGRTNATVPGYVVAFFSLIVTEAESTFKAAVVLAKPENRNVIEVRVWPKEFVQIGVAIGQSLLGKKFTIKKVHRVCAENNTF
jgi:hypothetical protein